MVDNRGRIKGEVRRYDAYARIGEILLYDIDSFGYVYGYISRNWQIMSEEDIRADKRLTNKLCEAKYQIWKRHNITDLLKEYKIIMNKNDNFERFCREVYRKNIVDR